MPLPTNCKKLRCISALTLLLAYGASAQEVVELKPSEHENFPKGKVAAVKGTADKSGHLFTLGNLSVSEPVSITVFALDQDDNLLLSLFKPEWISANRLERLFAHEPITVASTNGEGHQSLHFRTQGELGIKVQPKDSGKVPYELVVWIGEEIRPDFRSKLVSKEEFERQVAVNPDLYPESIQNRARASVSPLTIAIAGLLSLIAILLGILIWKMR